MIKEVLYFLWAIVTVKKLLMWGSRKQKNEIASLRQVVAELVEALSASTTLVMTLHPHH